MLGMSDESDRLLREAAKLTPNDAAAWYLAWQKQGTWTPVDERARQMEWLRADLEATFGRRPPTPLGDGGRWLLERSLAADPNFLPARYAYAATKPSHEQRMRALEPLGDLDPDNGLARYLMAILQNCFVSRAKKMDPETGAYVLSEEEWASIMRWIEKGNERPVLRHARVPLPSARDLHVSTSGKRWPQAAVDGYLNTLLEVEFFLDDPLSGARARKLARQAAWQAQRAEAAGETEKALAWLRAIRVFGHRYASAQPQRGIPFMVGHAVRAVAAAREREILAKHGRQEELEHLTGEAQAWKAAARRMAPLLDRMYVTVKGVQIGKGEPLRYCDYTVEEAGVREALRELGLPAVTDSAPATRP